jgi:transposase
VSATAGSDLPNDVEALKAILLAERETHRIAMRDQGLRIEKLKQTIARLQHDRYGQSSERRALLSQLELQLFELEETLAEDETKLEIIVPQGTTVQSFERRKPARRPLPEHLPRERIVYPVPQACPCCGGALHKLGEDVTEMLELVPRQWKVIQHVREKHSCRTCEAITQPPAPSHPIARGRAGPNLLAHVLFGKYGLHLPLTRQSATYAREGIDLDVSTLADWVGASAATLMPLIEALQAYVFSAERIHADDTTVPVLDVGKTRTGRLWAYVRDDRPFAGPAPPAAVYFYSADRTAGHPEEYLAGWQGFMQADAYSGFNRLYEPMRQPGPIVEVACWRMRDATSSIWCGSRRRRLASKRSPVSTCCSPSSARSMVRSLPSAAAFVRNVASRWSTSLASGCASSTRASRPPARSARRSPIALTSGTLLYASSTMVASA